MEIPEDIKKILIAVDQLLEALPEEEIDKFLNSPEFPLYKKIMNEIYGVQEEESGDSEEYTQETEEETWERTQEQALGDKEVVEPVTIQKRYVEEQKPAEQHRQVSEQREFNPAPFELKEPIERLKKPTYVLERDVATKEEEKTPELVEDVEEKYDQRFEEEQETRESKELREFSQYLKTKEPASLEPISDEERKLVDFINQQIEKGMREPDIRTALTKVGWSAEVLDKCFDIAKDIRIRDGKQHVKKYGVDFM